MKDSFDATEPWHATVAKVYVARDLGMFGPGERAIIEDAMEMVFAGKVFTENQKSVIDRYCYRACLVLEACFGTG